jgi:transposase-like protein
MSLTQAPKGHRFPVSIISEKVWLYHRFNNSLRDVEEQLAFRGIIVSYETIREWHIKFMCPQAEHRSHKGLNNRVENAHQLTRRKEKCLIRFKSPQGVQRTVSLMGKVRNLFALEAGRYSKKAHERRKTFETACQTWSEAAHGILHVLNPEMA